MDAFADWFIHHFKTEWDMIANAPFLFLFIVVLVGIGLYFLLHKHFEGRLATGKSHLEMKDSHIELLNSQLDDYRNKLSGLTPDQAAKEIDELKEDLQNTRAQMEMITKWYRQQTFERHLTDEQKEIIGKQIDILPEGSRRHIFVASMQDSEATLFASELLAVFRSRGICSGQGGGPAIMQVSSCDERGVLVVVRDEHNPPEHAVILRDILNSAGIETMFDTVNPDPIDPNYCTIFVAPKPPLFK